MPDITAMSLAVASTAVAAVAMVFFKLAAKADARKIFLSRRFFAGGFLFVFGAALMILALKLEELSVLFPLTSLTYIWVMLLSRRYLKERLDRYKVLVVAFIVLGIIFAAQ